MHKPQITTRRIAKTIYGHIAACGQPVVLPEPWHHLKVQGPFFQAPQDCDRLLTSLKSEFSVGDLVDCGVLELDSAGAVALTPMLLNPVDVLYAPRRARLNQPFQLLSSTCALPAWKWSIEGLLQDYCCQRLREGSAHVVVTDGLSDVTALWASGIPALPAAGLTLLAEPRLGTLRRFLNVPSLQDSQRILTAEAISWGEDWEPKPFIKLVFANFSVGQLTANQPECITNLCAHFRGLQTHMLPPEVCWQWTPPAADLEALQFCLRFGKKYSVHAALVESIESHSLPLVANEAVVDMASVNSVTNSTIALIDDCMKLLPTLVDSKRYRRVWTWLLATLEHEFVRPLLVAAESASDPAEKSRLHGLAQTARLLHPKLLELNSKYLSAAARGDLRSMASQIGSVAQLEPLLKMHEKLARRPGAAR